MDKVDKYLNERMGDGVGVSPTADTRPVFKGLIGTLEDIEKMIQYNNMKGAKDLYKWMKKRLKDIEQFL